jgi:hypothetical protein
MAHILVWLLGFVVFVAGAGCTSHPARPEAKERRSKDQPRNWHQHGSPSRQPTRELAFPTQPPPTKTK